MNYGNTHIKAIGLIALTVAGVMFYVTCFASHSSIDFSAETSNPHTNTFNLGEPVRLYFNVTDRSPLKSAPSIDIRIAMESGTTVFSNSLTLKRVADKRWKGYVKAPHKELGYYRVYAVLHIGERKLLLPGIGSRPKGFLTYCVVKNPDKRQRIPEKRAFFGMQGGFSKETMQLMPMLGIRWVLGNLDWSRYAPDSPTQFMPMAINSKLKGGNPIFPYAPSVGTKKWQIFPLPTLYMRKPEWIAQLAWKSRFGAWDRYCKRAAAYFMDIYPNLPERIYQITWEPNFPWQFSGTKRQLVDWYRIAYKAIHGVDHNAVVIGPAGSSIQKRYLGWDRELIKMGIWRYIDGFSIHPYTNRTVHGVRERLPVLIAGLRELQKLLRGEADRNIPIYATEAGYQADFNLPDEMRQARYIVESNIIMRAMGVRLSLAFYIADYPKRPGFGIYYNDLPGEPFGSSRLSPKPAAPAYSAMTYFLAGAVYDGRLKYPKGIYAYKFHRRRQNVIVFWNLDSGSMVIHLPQRAGEWRVYDWMGNHKSTYRGSGTIKLGENPIYVIHKR